MRYRALSASGDYTVGIPFLVNSAATVAQAILTRLQLWQGSWFLDLTDGTPYLQNPGVLGVQPAGAPDAAIQSRILQTPGVQAILAYSSSITGARAYSVNATVMTIYGQATLQNVPVQLIPQSKNALKTDAGIIIKTDAGTTILTDP